VGRFYVYIVECRDGTLYTGIAGDVARRVREHNEAKIGAKYTKTRRPVVLRYFERKQSRGAALSREATVKKLSRTEKLALIRRHATISRLPVADFNMGKGDNRQQKEKKKPKKDKDKKK
jgi:putative endonuclease